MKFWICKCGMEIEKPEHTEAHEIICPACKRTGCVEIEVKKLPGCTIEGKREAEARHEASDLMNFYLDGRD